MDKRKKEKIILIIENWYPLILSAFSVILSFQIEVLDDLANVIGVAVNSVAILLGFIGVTIGLLLTSNNSLAQKVLDDSRYRIKIEKFYIRCFQSGFILIFLSIIMYLKKTFINYPKGAITVYDIVKYLWLFFLVYSLISSYRVITITIKIVFSNEQSHIEEKKEYKELEKKYAIKENISDNEQDNKNT